MIRRRDLLEAVAAKRTDEIVVHTMSTCNDWPGLSRNHSHDFFVGGAMGFASTVGLGLAMAQPHRRVWILDGDGSLMMNLGTLITIAEVAPSNLVHVTLSNNSYELVGRIATPGSKASLSNLALDAGYREAHLCADGDLSQLASLLDAEGPVFIDVPIELTEPDAMKGDQAMDDAVTSVRKLAGIMAKSRASLVT